MKQLARRSDALPLNANTYYEGNEDTTTWDEARIFGCVCDSAWTVGLASGETQEPEWFGADCSQRKFFFYYSVFIMECMVANLLIYII